MTATLADRVARSREAARDVARRLRENARSPHPLPLDVRREVFETARMGYPRVAALALDEYLAEQAAS